MKLIGVCGPSGSGKGVVLEGFEKIGIPTINADEVYHKLTSKPSECVEALRAEFGDEIIFPDGSLDRRSLAKIVFAPDGAEKRNRLNEISHKFVIEEIRRIVKELSANNKMAALEAPLLFESGLCDDCDIIIGVEVENKVRIERICKRDGISKKEARARIKSQLDDRALDRVCDYIIDNYGTKEEIYRAVEKIVPMIEEQEKKDGLPKPWKGNSEEDFL